MIGRRESAAGILFGCFFFLALSKLAAQQVRIFHLSEISGALSSLYQITHEELRSSDVTSLDVNRSLLQGGIQLNTAGSVYHPNLLTFRVDLNLVGLRSQRKVFSDASLNNSLNNTYNVNLTFLKKKALFLELYSLRSFSSADRAFLERYFTTFQSSGIRLTSQAEALPFQLHVYKTWLQSESEVFKEREEQAENLDFRAQLIDAERVRSNLTLRWKDYTEAVYNVDFSSLDFLTDFSFSYGEEIPNRFYYQFTVNRMQGDFDIERYQFRLSESHYLKKNLLFNGTYTILKDSSFGRSSNRNLLSGEITHRLFESLTSSFLLGGRREKTPFQSISGLRNRISLAYLKRIPTGNLQLIYARSQERTDFDSRSGSVFTIETHNFSLSDSFFLTMPGINTATIRVTDTELSDVYIEGVDYRVDIIADQVAVTRLPGGRISPNASVLVHFDYTSYPDFLLNSRFQQFNFRLNFLNYFQAYYLGAENNFTVTSEFVIPPFESYTRDTLGSRLISPIVNLEYNHEWYESLLSKYLAQNFRASAQARIFRNLELTASLSMRRLEYFPAVFDVDYRGLSLEGSYTLRDNVSAQVIYRSIYYSTTTSLNDRESLLFKFQWTFRRIVLNVFFEHVFIEYGSSGKLRDYFSIILRRLF